MPRKRLETGVAAQPRMGLSSNVEHLPSGSGLTPALTGAPLVFSVADLTVMTAAPAPHFPSVTTYTKWSHRSLAPAGGVQVTVAPLMLMVAVESD